MTDHRDIEITIKITGYDRTILKLWTLNLLLQNERFFRDQFSIISSGRNKN